MKILKPLLKLFSRKELYQELNKRELLEIPKTEVDVESVLAKVGTNNPEIIKAIEYRRFLLMRSMVTKDNELRNDLANKVAELGYILYALNGTLSIREKEKEKQELEADNTELKKRKEALEKIKKQFLTKK